MKTITRRASVLFVLIAAFFIGLGFLLFSFITHGSTWASSRLNTHVFTNRQLAAAGAVLDRNGKVLVETKDGARVWTADSTLRKASLHLVGDAEGYISTGVQTLYRSSLIGYNFVNGLYRTGEDGGNDVRLTIDSEAQKAAYNALGGGKGTICAYNYRTGEVLCMVSAPTYDPMYKPSSMNTSAGGAYDGVYMNRFLNGVFTPGSTFKVVTAICALDNLPNVRKRSFTCTGSYKIGDSAVKCNGVHGKLTFERALNVSCNSVFAELAKELGNDALTATVRQLGFGKNVKVSGALTTKSTFDLRGAAAIDRGWAGIGQYTTLVNPCQMLMLAGAIANGGTAIVPYVVESSSKLLDVKGQVNKNIQLSETDAKIMRKLLRSNVENYYGDSRFPNLQFCGKTGSAAVIGGRSHAWFFGFSLRSDFPVAIVVCLENGGIGLNNAVPAANKVLQAIKNSTFQIPN